MSQQELINPLIDAGSRQPALETKSRMRRMVRDRILSMPLAERRAADLRIRETLRFLADEISAKFVLGYLALGDEVRIDAFLAEFIDGRGLALLPRAVAGALRYGKWRPVSRISRDEEGVLAPDDGWLEELPEGPGLIVVPGRAFDSSGRRLGRGGGYYDRFLAGAKYRLIVGVAYDCQIVDVVPAENHDRNVSCLVTESGMQQTGFRP